MLVFEFDEDGFFISPVEIADDEEIPVNCTRISPPKEGHFQSRFNGEEWVEGAPDELVRLKNSPPPVDPFTEIKKQQADLIFELMMNGVI